MLLWYILSKATVCRQHKSTSVIYHLMCQSDLDCDSTYTLSRMLRPKYVLLLNNKKKDEEINNM